MEKSWLQTIQVRWQTKLGFCLTFFSQFRSRDVKIRGKEWRRGKGWFKRLSEEDTCDEEWNLLHLRGRQRGEVGGNPFEIKKRGSQARNPDASCFIGPLRGQARVEMETASRVLPSSLSLLKSEQACQDPE